MHCPAHCFPYGLQGLFLPLLCLTTAVVTTQFVHLFDESVSGKYEKSKKVRCHGWRYLHAQQQSQQDMDKVQKVFGKNKKEQTKKKDVDGEGEESEEEVVLLNEKLQSVGLSADITLADFEKVRTLGNVLAERTASSRMI